MESEKQMKCNLCGCGLEPAGVKFSYLGSRFSLEALRCPKCGQVFITEHLADGRIHATESFLEDRKMFQSN
ncbi:MAG: DVU_1557 family redox protein [Lentihominibacter sp.]